MNRQPAIAALRQKLIHSEDLTEVDMEQLIRELQGLQSNKALGDHDRDLIRFVISELRYIDQFFQKNKDLVKKHLEKTYLNSNSQQERINKWNNQDWDMMCDSMWMDITEITGLCTKLNSLEFFNSCAKAYIKEIYSYLHGKEQSDKKIKLWKEYMNSTFDVHLKPNNQRPFYQYLGQWRSFYK